MTDLSHTRSKFKFLPAPIDIPGKCINCGAVDRPVLDFGISVDFENLGFGVLYLCITCITEAAAVAEVKTNTVVRQEVDAQDIEAAKAELIHEFNSFISGWFPSFHKYDHYHSGLIGDTSEGTSGNFKIDDSDESESGKPNKASNRSTGNKRTSSLSSSSSDGSGATGFSL